MHVCLLYCLPFLSALLFLAFSSKPLTISLFVLRRHEDALESCAAGGRPGCDDGPGQPVLPLHAQTHALPVLGEWRSRGDHDAHGAAAAVTAQPLTERRRRERGR